MSVDEIDLDNLTDADKKPLTISTQHAQLVRLNIPMKYGSLELIDGQHRLFAFTKTEPATRSAFNLVVIGLMGLDEKQERDTFLAINDTAKRVDPNLVAYLRYEADDAKCQGDAAVMAIRIVVDMNDRPPFKRLIRLLDTGPAKSRITLKGFSGYDLKGLLSTNGALRKIYPENRPDQFITAFTMYFSAIRDLFYDEWKDPDTYIIATNRGISGFLKLYRSLLRFHKAEIDYATAKQYLEPLTKHWPTWETTKLRSSYVGSQGWKSFHRDLVAAIKKTFPKLQP